MLSSGSPSPVVDHDRLAALLVRRRRCRLLDHPAAPESAVRRADRRAGVPDHEGVDQRREGANGRKGQVRIALQEDPPGTQSDALLPVFWATARTTPTMTRPIV